MLKYLLIAFFFSNYYGVVVLTLFDLVFHFVRILVALLLKGFRFPFFADMYNYNQLCILANGEYKHLFI